MSNFQPTLTWDEQLATGWARVEVYGDRDAARAMLKPGRSLLGSLKSYTNVNQQQVNDRETTGGGGLYHRWATLPDGSKIHVLTNDGHDTIRLYPVKKEVEEEKKKKRPDEATDAPYMWVGIRVPDGQQRPPWGLNVMMVEPDGGIYRGYIGTGYGAQNNWTESWWFRGDGSNDDGWVFTPGSTSPTFYKNSLAEGIERMLDIWGDDTFSASMEFGDHCFDSSFSGAAGEFTDPSGRTYLASPSPMINWSANGLMLQHFADQPHNSHGLGPHDPKMSPEENAGSLRSFDGLDTSVDARDFDHTGLRFGWDAVFWLDPFDFKAKPGDMVDDRPLIKAFRKHLRDMEFVVPPAEQAMEGVYRLYVSFQDEPAHLESTRSGEHIDDVDASDFGVPDGPGDIYWYRSPFCDFMDYLELTDTYPPLSVEVEVRLGRRSLVQRSFLPDPAENKVKMAGKTFNFTVTCQTPDDRWATVWPHGVGTEYDECSNDFGPNWGGPAYGEVIHINVMEQSAELGDGTTRGMFEQTYRAPVDQERRRAMFFIYTAFPPPSAGSGPGEWEQLAARALYEAMQAVSTGVFGCSEMNDANEAALAGVFAGTTPSGGPYVYDPASGDLQPLGPPATTSADWAPYDPPHDSTNFFWYYEKAIPYRNQCIRTYGIVVTSVGGFFDMSQNFADLGPMGYSSPDCC